MAKIIYKPKGEKSQKKAYLPRTRRFKRLLILSVILNLAQAIYIINNLL